MNTNVSRTTHIVQEKRNPYLSRLLREGENLGKEKRAKEG